MACLRKIVQAPQTQQITSILRNTIKRKTLFWKRIPLFWQKKQWITVVSSTNKLRRLSCWWCLKRKLFTILWCFSKAKRDMHTQKTWHKSSRIISDSEKIRWNTIIFSTLLKNSNSIKRCNRIKLKKQLSPRRVDLNLVCKESRFSASRGQSIRSLLQRSQIVWPVNPREICHHPWKRND